MVDKCQYPLPQKECYSARLWISMPQFRGRSPWEHCSFQSVQLCKSSHHSPVTNFNVCSYSIKKSSHILVLQYWWYVHVVLVVIYCFQSKMVNYIIALVWIVQKVLRFLKLHNINSKLLYNLFGFTVFIL